MSDSPVDRTVLGPPRKPAASSLIRANRQPAVDAAPTSQPQPAPAPATSEPATDVASPKMSAPSEPAHPSIATSQPHQEPEQGAGPVKDPAPVKESATWKMTFHLPSDLRLRVRAVFKATKDFEGELTFAQMLSGIIERECEAREAKYNKGERFRGGEQNLPRGRPFV